MKTFGTHNYYVYILTNHNKSVLYIGVTNDLKRRLIEHNENTNNNKEFKFTTKYNCTYLIYWERFQWIDQAIAREKQIKGWVRKKKEELITSFNPSWKFLNENIVDSSATLRMTGKEIP